MKVLLDTNAYSALMARDSEACRTVAQAEHLYLPVPVIGELLFGFQLGSRKVENLAHLQQFLAQSVVSTIGMDFEVCEVYARIGKMLRAAGTPIPSNDHWIAAIAMRNNFTLLTRDRHFRRVPGLAVAGWDGELV